METCAPFVQVFVLELLVPFVPYSAIGMIPVRVITGVPEIVCVSLVATQAAVCVLAQMRYLLPLVLFSVAPERTDEAECQPAT